jgi:hypothetical protein
VRVGRKAVDSSEECQAAERLRSRALDDHYLPIAFRSALLSPAIFHSMDILGL